MHIESQQGVFMAKAKRISIGFQPATLNALQSLSDATGQSISGIVSGFMDEAAPTLGDIAKAVELAKSKPVEAFDLMAEQLAVATEAASQGQLELVELRKRHNKRRAKK
jgi:hypothetical protein